MLPWKLGPSHTQQSRPRAHGRRMVNTQRTATGRRVEWKTNTHRSSFHQHSFRGNKNTRTYNWSYDDRYTVHQADFSFQIHGCCSRRRFGGSHSVRPLFLLLLLDFHFVCLLSVMTSWSVKMVPPFPSSQPVTFSPLPFPMPVCDRRSRRQANVCVSLNRHYTASVHGLPTANSPRERAAIKPASETLVCAAQCNKACRWAGGFGLTVAESQCFQTSLLSFQRSFVKIPVTTVTN